MLQQIKDNLQRYKLVEAHYTELCKKNNITIKYIFSPIKERYRSNWLHKTIEIPHPTTLNNITIIYHELGHLLHCSANMSAHINKNPSPIAELLASMSRPQYVIQYECCANFWAIRNAPIKLSYKTLNTALKTYTRCEHYYQPKKLLRKLNDQMMVKCKL